MITNYLPKFKVLEPNNLTGLRNGHMLAQMEAAESLASVTIGDARFIQNGVIASLDADGKVGNYIAGTQPFVVYNEEIGYVLPDHKYYATPVGEECPRAIALYVGDTITTNNVDGTIATAKYAKVVNGVITLQTTADANSMFIAKPATLADGTAAVELLCYRIPASV